MPILAFLGSRIGSYILIASVVALVSGGGYLYVKSLNRTIADLHQQMISLQTEAATLQATNKAMQDDIANVEAAQLSANVALSNIRDQTNLTLKSIMRAPKTGVNVNKQWQNTLHQLESVANAP